MSEVDYMTECMTRDLAVLLVQENGMSLLDALDAVYNSDTYAKLKDKRTGLYFQSPAYVYDYLIREISSGKMY
ncbi:MAG: hypothetical protein IJY31_01630 [Muribaculaceae bacterium]|nr:hypothetical protein [Muribaculaceae bacterium]